MYLEQAKEVLRIEAEGINSLLEQIGEDFNKAVEMILACPGRLIITGIGKSGIIGQKIAATLNSTGTSSFFLHPFARDAHKVVGRVFGCQTHFIPNIIGVLELAGDVTARHNAT